MMTNWPNQLYIDGQWFDGTSRRTWKVVNPATGSELANVAIADSVSAAVSLPSALEPA